MFCVVAEVGPIVSRHALRTEVIKQSFPKVGVLFGRSRPAEERIVLTRFRYLARKMKLSVITANGVVTIEHSYGGKLVYCFFYDIGFFRAASSP